MRRSGRASRIAMRRPLLLRRLYPYLPRHERAVAEVFEAFFAYVESTTGDPLVLAPAAIPRRPARCKEFLLERLRQDSASYDALDECASSLPRTSAVASAAQAQISKPPICCRATCSVAGRSRAMAHAVEGRFPFLDHRVLNSHQRIPPRPEDKTLARKTHPARGHGADLLPPRSVNRPKQPYRAPDARVFQRLVVR